MAEIHVEAKKHHSGSAWLWILIGIIIAAIIIYFVTRNNRVNNSNTATPSSTTSGISLPQGFAQTTFVMSEAGV